MALIETEFNALEFASLVKLFLSAAPIPVPTLTVPSARSNVLGDDQLLGGLAWGDCVVGAAAPLIASPGKVGAAASVTISHVSIAELDASPAASHTTSATLWVVASTVLINGGTAVRLNFTATLINIPGTTSAFQTLAPPVPIAYATVPVPLGLTATDASLLLSNDVVTVRIATAATDDLLAPPLNLLRDGDRGQWLFRASGDVFADQVRAQVASAIDPPPSGTTIEDSVTAVWGPVTIFTPPVAPSPGEPSAKSGWGAMASVGLKKADACPGVNLSVTVRATLLIAINPSGSSVDLTLQISIETSEWDTFRCWLLAGAASALLGLLLDPVAGIFAAIASLNVFGAIQREVGKALAGVETGSGFTEIDRGETWVNYAGTLPIPSLPLPTATVLGSDVGQLGLRSWGSVAQLFPAAHDVEFLPASGDLTGWWSEGFSCQDQRWHQTFRLPYVLVKDTAYIPAVPTPPGRPLGLQAVRVFSTSTALPAGKWQVQVPVSAQVDPAIEIVCSASPGDVGRAFIHTSAGIRRFGIGTVTDPPGEPDPLLSSLMALNCHHFGHDWKGRMNVRWLFDPPPGDFVGEPLRQWLITLTSISLGSSITVHAERAGASELLFTATAVRTGEVALEVVTDRHSEILIEHTVRVRPPRARLIQRWLQPLRIERLPGRALSLRRSGDDIELLSTLHRTVFSLSTGDLRNEPLPRDGAAAERQLYPLGNLTGGPERRRGMSAVLGVPPFSLTLPGGNVAAILHDRLIIARPISGGRAATLDHAPKEHGIPAPSV